ncbi:hypothetical protein BU23DRAFT_596884 [Bimuria novae-zelandiae CBS 107.79]|uniref:Uncharacterized protein n=1 Tax=Bimuria novae-zelandiae CBS 107.79 TaxID=1447943 RepID=A0A6A5VL51_9PLEO|nr:hypothetical protein BU23DRAFT_596884 [Bimuria novae-zelandiae CBS 107.79]
MFSVSHGDIKSLFFWGFALIACFGAAIVLLIRWRCEVGPKKPKNLLMVLGHTIAGSIVFVLPLFSRDKIQGWNVQGLIAAFALFWLSLTEARPLFRSYLGTTLQRFWIGANVISLPAPVFLSILLFSPISVIELVTLLALSVAANWCFGPDYVLILGATTTASRLYVAYNYYETNGPWVKKTIEDAAVEDNSSSALLANIRELESVLSKRDVGPTQPSQPGASLITRQPSLTSNNTFASYLEEEDVVIGG